MSEAAFSISIPTTKTGGVAPEKSTAFAKIGSLIAHPMRFDQNTPEGRLILKLISRLLVVNLVFVALLMLFYFFWIRRIFNPINLIIERLRTYIDTARFSSIQYRRANEFTPLVSTINNLYQSLKIQDNIRSNFFSDISHEIRTPITAVKCYIEAIEDGVMALDEKTIPLLQTELDRLTKITSKMLDYDHFTQHAVGDIHVERFDLREEATLLIHEYLPQLEKNHQSIQMNQSEEVHIRMDKGMFRQILHNIFSNFIKYAGESTTLTCTFSRTKDTISMQFIDDGIGIPDKDLQFVKERFYRVDKSRTNNAEMSMGIGLSLVDHIVKIHDGSISLSNAHPS